MWSFLAACTTELGFPSSLMNSLRINTCTLWFEKAVRTRGSQHAESVDTRGNCLQRLFALLNNLQKTKMPFLYFTVE